MINSLNINKYYEELLKNKNISIDKKKSWKYIYDNNQSRLGNIAISHENTRKTYADMFARWEDHARVYTQLGITKKNGSRVLTIMPNLISTANIDYGLNITGAVCDFVDPTISYETLKKYIENENITDIAVWDLLYEAIIKNHAEELKKCYGIRNIITYSDKNMYRILPLPLRIAVKCKNEFKNLDKCVLRFDDLHHECQNSAIYYDDYVENDLSLITHTSGTTTGIGKPIPITDDNRNALVFQHELAGLNFEPGMKMLHFIPYFAAYGAVNTAHLGLAMGMELIQIPLFKPEIFGKLLLENKPNIVLANTPAWLNLMKDPLLQHSDLSFLNCAVSGGTPTNPNDEERLNEFLLSHGSKCILTKGHGLSELCGCGSYSIEGYNHVGGMGVPLPLTTYKIRDLNTNEIIETEEYPLIGEALINSPNMTSGILDGKIVVETIKYQGKRYLPTKDIIKVNADGSLEFVERKDKMFPRYDAYNVYPLNIERLINSFKEVEKCIIVPYFDGDKNGSMPKIYIKLKDEYKNIEMTEFIYEIINNYFIHSQSNNVYKANFRDIPNIWVLVDDIPTNTMGKEDYYKIKSEGIKGRKFIIEVDADNLNVSNLKVFEDGHQKIKTK